MVRIVVVLLLSLALLYGGACLFLFFGQRSMIYLPLPGPPGVREGLTSRATPGGQELLISVRDLPGPRAILYFGGNAEDVSFNLPELAAAFPGVALYCLHYRGYGGAPGQPSEDGLVADARALFDLVRTEHAEITVIGRSLGSGVAVQLAAARPVAKLVLITPYASLVDLGAAQFPLFPVRWLMRDRFESWRYAQEVAAPTLLIVAGADEIIPAASSARLLASFRPGVARSVVLPGVGHNTVSASREFLPTLAGGL